MQVIDISRTSLGVQIVVSVRSSAQVDLTKLNKVDTHFDWSPEWPRLKAMATQLGKDYHLSDVELSEVAESRVGSTIQYQFTFKYKETTNA